MLTCLIFHLGNIFFARHFRAERAAQPPLSDTVNPSQLFSEMLAFLCHRRAFTPIPPNLPMQKRIERRLETFDVLLDVARTINSKDPYTVTVPITTCTDRQTKHIDNWDLLPLNTWFVPSERLTDSTATSRRLVNPDSPNASHYTDIYGSVNIDQFITHPYEVNADQIREEIQSARDELNERRLEFLEDAASHFYTTSACAPRMDVNNSQVYEIADRNGIDYQEARLEGRDKVATVWSHLHDAGYSYSEISTVYRSGKSTVHRYVTDDSIGMKKAL